MVLRLLLVQSCQIRWNIICLSNKYRKWKKKLSFLCGYFENSCFIYGVKDKSDWHYFKDEDAIIDEHSSLPADLENRIKKLRGVETISITLEASQVAHYIDNDKFVFKGKELETCKFFVLDMPNHFLIMIFPIIVLRISTRSNPKKGSSTDDLVFIEGQTNPSFFLDRFERCYDVKTDRDKLFKIRSFVNEEDKADFSKYFFKAEWEVARGEFLKKYSYIFTENKRKALDFHFKEDTGLRSFVHKKMTALSMYTTLQLNNQLEIILAELPSDISCLFTRHLKINATKTEILEFCDSIQDLVDDDEKFDTSGNTTLISEFQQRQQADVVQDLEIFSYVSSDDQTEIESSEEQSSNSSRGRKRGRGKESRKWGGPSKIGKVIVEGTESSRSSTSSVSNF